MVGLFSIEAMQMGVFERREWTIVYLPEGRSDARLTVKDHEHTPRFDDTLGVVHFKLQQLTEEDIYWWVEVERPMEAWPDSSKYVCPYVFGAYARDQQASPSARAARNDLDVLSTFTNTCTIHVCKVADVHPSIAHVLPEHPSANIVGKVLSSAESALERADAVKVEAVNTSVTSLTIESEYDGFVEGVDEVLLDTLAMTNELVMFGVQASNGMVGLRISEDAVVEGRLERSLAMREASDLVYQHPKADTIGTYMTNIDGRSCSTRTYEGTLLTKSYDNFGSLEDALTSVTGAESHVAQVRKLTDRSSRDRPTTVDWVQISTQLASVIQSKTELVNVLGQFSPLLYTETTGTGNVIVYWKRVPNFRANSSIMQYIEHHAYQLTDGSLEALVSTLMIEYNVSRDDALHEIEAYKVTTLSQAAEYDVTAKYMKMISDVGAMATLTVATQTLKVSMRCVGDLEYVQRLLSVLSLVAMTSDPLANADVTTQLSQTDDISDLQSALAAVRDMDAARATQDMASSIKKNTYILDRLQTYDPQLFKYDKTRLKTYAKQCGAVNMRQPIAVSAGRMAELRETGAELPDAIRVGDGGTSYMCPEFWCPVTETPMTKDDIVANNGVCPGGETPMDLTSAEFWKDAQKRTPGLLAAEKHPLGLFAPCCFKNLKSMMLDRLAKCREMGQCPPEDEQTVATAPTEGQRYVMSGTTHPLPPTRLGHLPTGMEHEIFADIFRVGVDQDHSPFVAAVAAATGLSVEDVVGMASAKLTLGAVCRLGKGYLIRRFVDQSVQIGDPRHRESFERFMKSRAGIEYARELYQQGKELDTARDFVLWNGYRNVLSYIEGGRVKAHTFLVPLLMTALQTNIHVLELQPGASVPTLYCPYGYPERHRRSVVILKQAVVYEPLAGETDGLLQSLDSQQSEMCGLDVGPDASGPVNAYIRKSAKLNVEAQVVNMSFECVGLVVAGGLFVPHLKPAQFDTDLSVLYADQLRHTVGWTLKDAASLFEGMSSALGGAWFSKVEPIEDGGVSYVVLDDSVTVPVRNAANVMSLARQDLAIFLDTNTVHEEGVDELGPVYDDMMSLLAKRHPKELYVLTHPLCPFDKTSTMAKLMDLTSGLTTLEDDHARAAMQMVSRQPRKLGRVHRASEIFANEQDVLDGSLLNAFSRVERGFDAVDIARTMSKLLPLSDESSLVAVKIPDQWKPVLRPLVAYAYVTASYLVLRKIAKDLGGEQLTKKRYMSIVGKALLKDVDAEQSSGVLGEEVMSLVAPALRNTSNIKTEASKYSDVVPNAYIANIVLAMYDVNYIVISRDGSVAGDGRSTRPRYIIVIEMSDGRLAVCKTVDATSAVLSRDDLPKSLTKMYFKSSSGPGGRARGRTAPSTAR